MVPELRTSESSRPWRPLSTATFRPETRCVFPELSHQPHPDSLFLRTSPAAETFLLFFFGLAWAEASSARCGA